MLFNAFFVVVVVMFATTTTTKRINSMKIYALIVCENKKEMCVPCMFQMVDHWAKKRSIKSGIIFLKISYVVFMFYGSSLTTCSKHNLCIYLDAN